MNFNQLWRSTSLPSHIKILGICAGFIFTIAFVVNIGYLLSILWNYAIVPFGAPHLSPLQAIALLVFASLMKKLIGGI